MQKRPSPATRNLLAHCFATGGWIKGDPIRVQKSTILGAEKLGWVEVTRIRDEPIAAVLTVEAAKKFNFEQPARRS